MGTVAPTMSTMMLSHLPVLSPMNAVMGYLLLEPPCLGPADLDCNLFTIHLGTLSDFSDWEMDRTARNGRLRIQGATEPRFFVGMLRNKGKRRWKRSPTLIGNALQANRAES
jgi:hypothetical protein